MTKNKSFRKKNATFLLLCNKKTQGYLEKIKINALAATGAKIYGAISCPKAQTARKTSK